MNIELSVIESQGGIVSMAIDSLVNQVLKNADDGIEPTDEQIDSVISFHNVCGNGQRSAAYWFRQKRVHLKRGFESFEAFGKSVLGHESSHLHRLAKAYEIEQSLNSPIGGTVIPESNLRPLSKIEPNDRQDVWNEAIEKAREEGKKLGAKHVEEAVAEWKEKHEAVQNDLLAAKKSAENYQTMYSESSRQRDQLRDNQAQIIEAKLGEERAKLVLENSNAIAQSEKKASDLDDQLERLKKEQSKAIKDGVARELNTLQTEINQKRYQIEQHEKELAELNKTKSELDSEVGLLSVHKKSIRDIKENLTFLASSFTDAFDTREIPPEVTTEWQQIRMAIKKLDAEMDDFFDYNAPIDVAVLVGELL